MVIQQTVDGATFSLLAISQLGIPISFLVTMAAFLAADVLDMMEKTCRKNMRKDFMIGSEDVVVQVQDHVDCLKTKKTIKPLNCHVSSHFKEQSTYMHPSFTYIQRPL